MASQPQSVPSCHPRKPGEIASLLPPFAHALPTTIASLPCIAYSFGDVLLPAPSPRRPPVDSSTAGAPPCSLEPGSYLRAARGGRSPAAAPRGRSAGPCRERGAVRGAEAAPAPPEGPCARAAAERRGGGAARGAGFALAPAGAGGRFSGRSSREHNWDGEGEESPPRRRKRRSPGKKGVPGWDVLLLS